MELSVFEFTLQDAKTVCQWRYPAPYDCYNCPSWRQMAAQGWGMVQETKRREQFYSVRSDRILVGYFRLIDSPAGVAVGLGLAPEFCGRGLGETLMEHIKQTLNSRYPHRPAYLEVRAENTRALRCYKAAGFRMKSSVYRDTPQGKTLFLRLELSPGSQQN